RHPSTDGSAASATAAAPSGGADAGAAPSAAVAAVTEEEGCDVQGYDDRSVYLPNGGAGAGAPPSCVYEATRPGGYVAQGSWIIEIERGGFRRTLSAQAGDRACGEVGVIRPGDVVRATVRGGVESSGDPGSVRVGTRWSC
ncbi:MAG TPA: hypothetical protein VM933_08205, partial [Acidimicrobiales bacterium]|nr:hypothetical protein [Acidimicrobiales bacterium]